MTTADTNDEDNKDLTELFMQFATTLLAHFQEWEKQTFAKGTTLTPFFTDTGNVGQLRVWGGNSRILREHYEDIQALPEYQRCAEAHTTTTDLIPPKPRFVGGHRQRDPYLEKFPLLQMLEPVIDVLDKYESSKVTPENIHASYINARSTWAGDLIRWDICGLLMNFDCDIANPINFVTGVKIERFLPEEKNVLWRRLSSGFTTFDSERKSISVEEITNAKFRIATSITTNPNDNIIPDNEALRAVAWQSLMALRLLKHGLVGLSNIVSLPNFVNEGGTVRFSTSFDDFSIDIPLNKSNNIVPYLLRGNEFPQFLKILTSLSAGSDEDRKEMQTAFNRFNLAYQRDRAEDKVIDFTVALESLLAWGATQEIQYKFNLSCVSIPLP